MIFGRFRSNTKHNRRNLGDRRELSLENMVVRLRTGCSFAFYRSTRMGEREKISLVKFMPRRLEVMFAEEFNNYVFREKKNNASFDIETIQVLKRSSADAHNLLRKNSASLTGDIAAAELIDAVINNVMDNYDFMFKDRRSQVVIGHQEHA